MLECAAGSVQCYFQLLAPRDDRAGVGGRRRCPRILEGRGEVFPDTREQRCWWHYADLRIMPMWRRECLLMKRFTLEMSA
jgi:hypothetical protein